MKELLLGFFVLFISLGLNAQDEVLWKHSVVVYPSRILNFNFPAISIGYQYHPNSRWSTGATIGKLSNFSYTQNRREKLNGFDVGIEGRYRIGRNPNRPWGAFVGLELSRAYAIRPFGLEPTATEGVAKIIDTKVAARREEINFGLTKTWRFFTSFVLDVRLGMGVNSHSWVVADRNIQAAPKLYSIYDDDYHWGLRAGRAKERTAYVTPRIRIGIGYAF
ncbi:MAG: hypothetical protein AB8F78_05505 [Saprospiraceae bacterium]